MTTADHNEKILAELHPQLAVRLRILIHRASMMRDMEILIVSGYRPFAEQQKIYLSGAQAAPPGHSFHQLRLAADIIDTKHGTIPDRYDTADWDATNYEWLAGEGEATGMIAGHHWIHKDSPHFEYHPGWGPRAAHLVAKLTDENDRLPDDFFDHLPGIATG